MKYFLSILLVFFCNSVFSQSKKQISSVSQTTTHLLSLENKWLIAEFALDTAFLSSLMDPSFVSISDEGIHNKQQSLESIYSNISQRKRDSILIDSFNFENTVVHVYKNTAVIVLTVHTYGKNKTVIRNRRTRFYDVWMKRNGTWKAVSSQGTPLTE